MNKLRMILCVFVALFFAACSAEEQEEQSDATESISSVDTAKVKTVYYIPPNTNESSIGDTKRKRKFYIR